MILLCIASLAAVAAGYATFVEVMSRDRMLVLSAASYSDKPQACLDSKLNGAKVTSLVLLDCDYFGDKCGGFVYVDDKNKAIGLEYRGSTSAAQIIAQFEESVFEKHVAFAAGGTVTKYFDDAFQKMWDPGIGDAVKAAVAAYPGYDLWVSGHSLGGTIASLAAAYISKTGLAKPEKIFQYTFGEPRVGDKAWADAHDGLVPTTFRVTHSRDLVAHIPPEFLNYRHHEAEVYYKNKMEAGDTYKICAAQESHDCSEGDVDISIDDHLVYYGRHVSTWGRDGCV